MISHDALDSLFGYVLGTPVHEPSKVFDYTMMHQAPLYVALASPLEDAPTPVFEHLSVTRHYIPQSDRFDLLIRLRGRQVHVMVPAHIPSGEAKLLLHSEFRSVFGDLVEPIPKAQLGWDFGGKVGDIAGVAFSNPGLIKGLYEQQMQAYAVPPVPPSKGRDWRDTQSVMTKALPVLRSARATCPADVLCMKFGGAPAQLAQVIIHLNDHHKWARVAAEAAPGAPNIADWLEEYALRNGIDLTFKMPDESEMTK